MKRKPKAGYLLKWGTKYAQLHTDAPFGRWCLSFGGMETATRFPSVDSAQAHTEGFEDFKLKIVREN